MGWHYILYFELDNTEDGRSNNPWKGKHPRIIGKISVEMPPEDWLAHKMAQLNCTVAGGGEVVEFHLAKKGCVLGPC